MGRYIWSNTEGRISFVWSGDKWLPWSLPSCKTKWMRRPKKRFPEWKRSCIHRRSRLPIIEPPVHIFGFHCFTNFLIYPRCSYIQLIGIKDQKSRNGLRGEGIHIGEKKTPSPLQSPCSGGLRMSRLYVTFNMQPNRKDGLRNCCIDTSWNMILSLRTMKYDRLW